MKLRILNNSVRLRLSMDDMDDIQNTGSCFASCQLPGGVLSYGIELTEDLSEMSILLDHNTLKVQISASNYSAFHHSSDEGIYQENETAGQSYKIAVERDYKCLTPRSENEDRLFDNPREHH